MNKLRQITSTLRMMRFKHRCRNNERQRQAIGNEFYLEEKDMELCIMHMGTVIHVFDDDDDVEQVLSKIAEYRGRAVSYSGMEEPKL